MTSLNESIPLFPYCRKCKGYRKMCGLETCPILDGIRERTGSMEIMTGDVASVTPPGIFIGTYNYPKVYAGPLAVVNPAFAYPTGKEYGKGMEEIISMNRNLYRASSRMKVNDVESKLPVTIQEAAMSSSFVDMELNITKKLGTGMERERGLDSPLTKMVEISSLKIASNPRIPHAVEYLHMDSALDSSEAVWNLYKSGFSIGYLEGVFSSGALGLANKRRLVPTRWSITAVDDIIYRKMKDSILNMELLSEIEVFRNSYNGNSFTIILLPYSLAYEMQEVWQETSLWGGAQEVSLDYEFTSGRRKYADRVGGAYYAARLAAFEYLSKLNRQAAVIVLRTVGQEYYSPLGVWLVRETVRKAFEGRPTRYSSVDELIRSEKPGIRNWHTTSKVLRQSYVQKSILEYI